MTDKSAYGVVIGFGGAALCVLIVALAQLFGQFRHVMPEVREWLITHTEAAHQVIAAWDRMTLPAYVLQLLTNTPASALSGQQARAIRLTTGSRCFFLID